MFLIPFVIYPDFELVTNKINNTEPNSDCSYTMIYQKHEPLGYCLYVKSNILDMKTSKKIFIKPINYSKKLEDGDVALSFVNTSKEIIKEIYQLYFRFPKKNE